MSKYSDRRDFLKLTAASASALTLAGLGLSPGLATAQDKRTLTVAWDTDIDTLDPASFKSIGGYTVQANIYDSPLMWKVQPVAGKPGLLQSKPGEMDGGIAESWAFEKNNATLVLKIRKGVKFPSGKPVNATSVKYLFDRGLQSPGYMRILFPRLLRVTKPDQFEVRDEYTFAINMPAPSPMALDTMALINNALLDPDEVKAHATAEDPWATNWLKRNTAGLGPYQLVKNEPGVEIVLEARKDHWRGAPYFERVVFKFVPNEADRVLLLKRKAIDMVVGRPGLSPRNDEGPGGRGRPEDRVGAGHHCHWLCMNTAEDAVQQRQGAAGHQLRDSDPGHHPERAVRLRQRDEEPGAEPHAGPRRDGLALQVRHREGEEPDARGRPGQHPGAHRTGGPRGLAAARAGRGVDPDRTGEDRLQGQRSSRKTDAAFRQASIKGDHALSIESWQSWINDPFFHLFFNFHTNAKGTNSSKYSNPVLDKLIDENMHETNAAKRLAAAHQAQKILIGEGVWGFLWYDNWTRVMRADLVGIEKRWDTFERYFNMKLA